MSSGLFPCGGCQRHVRASEHACPFCGKPLERSEPLTELRLLTPLDRSRIVALGAVLSAAGMALSCREPAVAIYGGPPSPPSSVGQPEERAPAPPLTIATPSNPAPPPSTSAPRKPEPPPPPPKPTATSKPAPAPTDGRDPRMAPAYGGPPSPRPVPDIPK